MLTACICIIKLIVEPNIKPSKLQERGQQEALAGVGINGGASSALLSSCHKPHKHLVFVLWV